MSAPPGQGDSIILEEKIDPNYVPTQDEVIEYAKWIGMDLDTDQDLLWIAREGLKAPLPDDWKPCKTPDTDEIYYFNFSTGDSAWDHPCDKNYRKVYADQKSKSKAQSKPKRSTGSKIVGSIEWKATSQANRNSIVKMPAQEVFTFATEACNKQDFELCYVAFAYFSEQYPDIVEGRPPTCLFQAKGSLLFECGLSAVLSRQSSVLEVVGGYTTAH